MPCGLGGSLSASMAWTDDEGGKGHGQEGDMWALQEASRAAAREARWGCGPRPKRGALRQGGDGAVGPDPREGLSHRRPTSTLPDGGSVLLFPFEGGRARVF